MNKYTSHSPTSWDGTSTAHWPSLKPVSTSTFPNAISLDAATSSPMTAVDCMCHSTVSHGFVCPKGGLKHRYRPNYDTLPPDLSATSIWLALSPASGHRYQAIFGAFFAFNTTHGLPFWLPIDRVSHSRMVVAWFGAHWHSHWDRPCGATVLAYFFVIRKSEYARPSGKGQDHRVRVKH